MVFLRHLHMRWMVYGSTRTMRSSITPPARRDRALTSSGVKLMAGPSARMMERVDVVISSLHICCRVWPRLMEVMEVLPVVPLWQRYATWQHRAATGKPLGFPVQPCPKYSHLTPLFFFVKRVLKKSARARVCGLAEAALKSCFLRKNWMFLMRKGWLVLSMNPLQSSPGQSRKKKAIQARLLMACLHSEPDW